MGRISALTELTSLASDDYLVVLDSSANIAKKITIANAFGIADLGWTASGESWTYNAYNSTTRIGIITVPTDATTKYYEGMRIKITQATGGTKYGIIHDVAATALHVFFKTGQTLVNEAITSPFYSIADTPLGFSKDPADWTVTFTDSTLRSQGSPVLNTWYNPGSLSQQFGRGAWDLYSRVYVGEDRNTTGRADCQYTISTSNNSESDSRNTMGIAGTPVLSGTAFLAASLVNRRTIVLTADTTYYINVRVTSNGGAGTNVYILAGTGFLDTVLALTSAYL